TGDPPHAAAAAAVRSSGATARRAGAGPGGAPGPGLTSAVRGKALHHAHPGSTQRWDTTSHLGPHRPHAIAIRDEVREPGATAAALQRRQLDLRRLTRPG